MRYETGLRSVALGLLGASALATALYAQEGGANVDHGAAPGTPPCRRQRRRRQQVPAGAAGRWRSAPASCSTARPARCWPKQVIVLEGERITEVGPESQVKVPAGAKVIDLSQATVLPGLIDAHTHMFNPPKPGMSRETSTLIAVQNLQADLAAGFTTARDMSSHGNGYGDVDIRNAINEGRIDGPRYKVSGRGIVWGAQPADRAGESAHQHRGALGRRGERRGARAHRARRRLDQAVPDRRLFVQPDRRGAIRADLSDAGAAGADRRDPSPRPQDRLPRLRRRGPEERDPRRLRHHRARLRPRPGAGRHDRRQGPRPTIRRCSATPSPTWTTTTPRTPAASTG